jgi:hypothetical protein
MTRDDRNCIFINEASKQILLRCTNNVSRFATTAPTNIKFVPAINVISPPRYQNPQRKPPSHNNIK